MACKQEGYESFNVLLLTTMMLLQMYIFDMVEVDTIVLHMLAI